MGKGKRVDAFKFADTKLSQKIGKGFHAVALDERRNDFTPTLWDPTPNVVQRLFPGAHGDVGGGYSTMNNESGLSDGALQWMIEQLAGVGVLFSAPLPHDVKPNPAGTAHKPWVHVPWTLPGIPLGPRHFSDGMSVDSLVMARKAAGNVIAEPGEHPTPYQPNNLPNP
jgi:Uncharacterized alpha/beta hydrolase domain (DUF2235)